MSKNTKVAKKAISIVLSVVMIIAMMPVTVFTSFAEETSYNGEWVHRTDTDYSDNRGTYYVSMWVKGLNYYFTQTEDNQEFSFTSEFWAVKNDGINTAKINSVNLSDSTFNIEWSLLSGNSSTNPNGADLKGSLGSNYSKQLQNNLNKWQAKYTFTADGANVYTPVLNVAYTSGSTGMSTSSHDTTSDNEPINYTINVCDVRAINQSVADANGFIADGTYTGEQAQAVQKVLDKINENFILDGSEYYDQSTIDTAVDELHDLMPADFTEYETAYELAQELLNDESYSDSQKLAIEKTIADAETIRGYDYTKQDLVDAATGNILNTVNSLVPEYSGYNGGWQHKVDTGYSDYRGTNYVSMWVKGVNFFFTQTEDDQNFTFNNEFWAVKNDGINNAVINSVTVSDSTFSPKWSKIEGDSTDKPNEAPLEGSIGSGYSSQIANHLNKWLASYEFTAEGEKTYTPVMIIAYTSGATGFNTSSHDTTSDGEPINLKITVSDARELLKTIANANNSIAEGKFTQEQTEKLQSVLDNISQNYTLDGTMYYEQSVLDGLVADILAVTPADYTAVNELVEKINSMDTTGYTEETVHSLKNAVDSIDWTLDVTQQATVDGYVDALNEALNNLEVDKTELSNAIDNGKTLDTGDLTDDSKNTLDETVKNAEDVFNNPDATVEEVKNATDKLNGVIKSLETKAIIVKDTSTIIVDRDTDYTYMVGLDVEHNTVDDIKASLENNEKTVVILRNGVELSANDLVGTACIVRVVSLVNPSIVYEEATVILYGDVNGDGKVDGVDHQLMLQDAFYDETNIDLNSVYYFAADLDGDKAIDGFDLYFQDGIMTGGRYFNQAQTLYK